MVSDFHQHHTHRVDRHLQRYSAIYTHRYPSTIKDTEEHTGPQGYFETDSCRHGPSQRLWGKG